MKKAPTKKPLRNVPLGKRPEHIILDDLNSQFAEAMADQFNAGFNAGLACRGGVTPEAKPTKDAFEIGDTAWVWSENRPNKVTVVAKIILKDEMIYAVGPSGYVDWHFMELLTRIKNLFQKDKWRLSEFKVYHPEYLYESSDAIIDKYASALKHTYKSES